MREGSTLTSCAFMLYNHCMSKPPIIVTGSPEWADDIERAAAPLGFPVTRYGAADGYVARLADDHAALIVVDGSRPDWAFWTTTPKVSPATRRIPVLVVARAGAARRRAQVAGADFAIAPAEIAARLPHLLAEHARVQPRDQRAALEAQCAGPLPPPCREAVEKFNAGQYYKQHDLFEAQWMAEDGPVRDLYRAVLQVGIAYFQITRGNRNGAHKMLLRAVQWLDAMPDACQGIDVARLRADAGRVRAALEALPEGSDLSGFDMSLLGKIHMVGED